MQIQFWIHENKKVDGKKKEELTSQKVKEQRPWAR